MLLLPIGAYTAPFFYPELARKHPLGAFSKGIRLDKAGLEPLIRAVNPALRHAQLSWGSQNYIRGDTYQRPTPCCRVRKPIGGGEVAPADGMRFVVPLRTVHAGSNQIGRESCRARVCQNV